MGKGDKRRPTLISREHENLQWALAYGRIGFDEYARKLKALKKREKGKA